MLSTNDLLREEITKLDHTLIPPGFNGDVLSQRRIQENLSKMIDTLGEQSSIAQGLNKVITTSERLRNAPTHILYLMKDSDENGGRGNLIGLLKVGRKQLYMFDQRNKSRQVEPLCVLDFFVLPNRQRHGLGRKLFDHMLQDMAVDPRELAVDGPSLKMEKFLIKNYGIELQRQSNNFAITANFFNLHDSTFGDSSESGGSAPVVHQSFGRFAASKPQSTIATVIHGSEYYPDTNNAYGRIQHAMNSY